jgi:hypothetical protein
MTHKRPARSLPHSFGETVRAEALYLYERLFGEIVLITSRDHAIDQLVAEM